MTYEQVVYTIDNKRRFGKACGRDVTQEFMEALGHPEKGLHIIHIAGTNGKGSVAAFVSSILQAASFASSEHYKVGLFTSPHLIDYTERIQIDGKQISREDVTRIGQQLLNMELKLEPTMFDYWLAMAMVYFKEQHVDYVVLETGLGGAKDSTNGLSQLPEVCAITSIGLEHTQYLGDTLAAIAGEKAGIIKSGVPVVIGEMDEEASQVIEARCDELGCDLIHATQVESDLKLGLFGGYQRKNAAVAVEIIRNLKMIVDNQTIANGLATAVWPGRMHVISESPYILVDGAHNPAGVTALRDSLKAEFPNQKFSFIMAVMADKNYVEMAQLIAPLSERIYTVTVDSERALQAKELADAIATLGVEAQACESYESAIDLAGTFNEKIIVFGSLYFIGEILGSGYDKNKS
ncbi:dihydrofolate synthase / folylpolyglutamate synthase [Pseudobutyrivibrio sp. UC1225]|uniref:bifunctional folylpolyglutamate synthase/dihydrofolate synthase n=1 Tax=Pseudobutyrivibrio sp. UC1225 TaxID=1798185 RepID=UPI0008E36CB5|nr:folylpolyglutamate synthase/dihydrofolate synthase family protein [Pseudobutyrivibrio sp. UC1225]SFN92685.1 dihydrofolate synthase / folylpolyglutamate synthase [Pseudobutyrivibrio sp. UC1225]